MKNIKKMDILSRYEHFPDPVTLLLVGTAATSTTAATAGLIGAGGAVTAAGLGTAALAGAGIYSGVSASQQGKAAQEMAEYSAEAKEQEKREIEKAKEYRQERHAEETERIKGELSAGLGKAGAVPSAGIPLLIKAKQASESELENLMIGYEGGVSAKQTQSQADIYRMEGKLARKRGRNKAIGSYIGAGATLLTGFAEYGDWSKGYTPEGKATLLRY